jgi:hypothetical protein
MHASLYVAFPKSEAEDAVAAENFADNFLCENGFCSDDSHQFSSGYADWYVVGGRWSGDVKYWDLVSRHGKEKADQWHAIACGAGPVTKTRGIDGAFKKIFGSKEKPLTDRAYKACNAMLNNKAMVGAMIKEKLLHDDISAGGALTSPGYAYDKDSLLAAADGTVWIVVVDYHS